MPLFVKNGVLFIATKVKGVTNYARPLSFGDLVMKSAIPDHVVHDHTRENIQDLLLDLKLNPDINKQIFVHGLKNVLLKKGNLIYKIGEIENKRYHGFEYSWLINNKQHSVVSYTITGKTNTPNVGINIEIQIYGDNHDIIEHILAQTENKT